MRIVVALASVLILAACVLQPVAPVTTTQTIDTEEDKSPLYE
jgi:hypothetical protein